MSRMGMEPAQVRVQGLVLVLVPERGQTTALVLWQVQGMALATALKSDSETSLWCHRHRH